MEPSSATAARPKEALQLSFTAIWVRDVLLCAVLLQAAATGLAVAITAPVPAAVAAVFLVCIIKLLNKHFETYQERKERQDKLQHDIYHWQAMSRLASIATGMERLLAPDGPISSMTITVNKLEQDYKGLQQDLQQACVIATTAQEDAHRKDLLVTSLQEQLAEAKRLNPVPNIMPAGLVCVSGAESGPSEGAGIGDAAGSLSSGLGVEELPAMTRTPGHSELGAPMTAPLASMTLCMHQSVAGSNSLFEQHPAAAELTDGTAMATSDASGGKAAGDSIECGGTAASSQHAAASDTLAIALVATPEEDQDPKPMTDLCLPDPMDGAAAAGMTSPGLIDAIKHYFLQENEHHIDPHRRTT